VVKSRRCSPEDVTRLVAERLNGLATSGIVRTELAKQFWGNIFGAVTDKYGIGWQVNIGVAGA
jgi:PhnB protein